MYTFSLKSSEFVVQSALRNTILDFTSGFTRVKLDLTRFCSVFPFSRATRRLDSSEGLVSELGFLFV